MSKENATKIGSANERESKRLRRFVTTFFLILSLLLQNFLFLVNPVYAATNTWDFSTLSNYTYDDTKIEFSSGQAQLKATSNWYNTSWAKRKPITITGSTGGAQTNYQVKVTVTYDFDMQVDFDDIRFASSDGTTLIDHWLESKTDSTTADFWVEVPSIPASPDTTTIYIYYGNSSVSSTSNGDNTFAFFDDFEEATSYVPGNNGAWCWFQDPRAVHYQGTYNKTYVGYINTSGDIKIWSYNHSNDATQEYTLHSALQIDDHAAPSILIRNDGYLIVFYSGHNGGQVYYRISTNPEDISSWEAEQTITGDVAYNYPNPIQLSGENNKIYLFYRKSTTSWKYVTSTDGGVSWSSSKTLLSHTDQMYTKIDSNNIDKIYFTSSPHPQHETASVYYFYYYNGSFYKADSTLIKTEASLPMVFSDLDLVYNGTAQGNYNSWIWDIAVKNGTPYITFATFPLTTDHRYNYARWTGSAWNTYEITAAGGQMSGGGAAEWGYSGGIDLDHGDPTILYLSKDISGQFEIQKATTSDGGSTWSFENITSSSTERNVRPVVIRNHTSDFPVVWMKGSYPSYTTYNTTIASTKLGSGGYGNLNTNKWTFISGTSGLSSSEKYQGSYSLQLQGNETVIVGKNINIADGVFHAIVKYPSGATKPMLTARASTSANTFYGARPAYNTPPLQSELYKRISGTFTAVGTGIAGSTNAWKSAEIRIFGSNIKFYYDNSLLIEANDSAISSGSMGARSSSNEIVYLDDVYIRKYVSPEPSVSVGSEVTLYDTGSPSINPKSSVAQAFTSLSGFSETATKNGGQIKYQISNDSGTIWYWYNSGWTTTTSGYTEANTASDINTNISTFPVGSKSFLFKAYLNSDGTQLAKLDSIDLTYVNDTTAPTISVVSSTPTSTGATITWTTDEDSSSKVDYGLTTSYGSSTTETDTSARVTSHSVGLSSLTSCTTYHYRVRSIDTALNETIDSDNTFTTTGCTSPSSSSNNNSSSTSTTVCSDTAPGAKAPWLYGAIAQDSSSVLLYFTEADNPVNKYVLEYGTKSGDYPYGVQDMGVNSRGQMTFLVKSLSSNTTYYFKVRGGNGCATGSWSNEISAKTKPIFSVNNLDIVSSELNTVNNPTPTPTQSPTKKETTKTQEETKPTVFNGYDVKVKVVDTAKKPVEGAKVTIHSKVQETITNKDGIAEFKNVEAGEHKVLIAYNNFEGEQSVNLTGNVKEFDLNVTVQQKAIALSPLAYGIIGIMGLVIILLLVMLIKARKNRT